MELYDVKDGVLNLNFHPGQSRAWMSDRRFVLVLAGTQGGKTSFGPWWLWREILSRGRGDYLAVTTSYPLFMLKMLPEMIKVFCNVLKIARFKSGMGVLELKDPETQEFWSESSGQEMWGRIILRSIASPSSLEAATAQAAWLDECGQDEWDVTSWEAIQRRLSIFEGRALGTTTVYNSGWLKTEWHDRWKGGSKDYDVVQFPSTQNPAFPKAEFTRMKEMLPDWRFRMFYEGSFAKPEGLIYNAYDDAILVEPFPIPIEWPRVVGVDFGGTNNAQVWLAEDRSVMPSIWYLYHEVLEGGMSTLEHTDKVRRKMMGIKNIMFAGGAPGEGQSRLDWTMNGVPVQQPTVADVEVGISNVITLLRQKRIRLFKTCPGIRHEFLTYHRVSDSQGNATDAIAFKERFHRLDALRYATTYISTGTAAGWLDAYRRDQERKTEEASGVRIG